VVGVSEKLALSWEYFQCSWHPEAVACWV